MTQYRGIKSRYAIVTHPKCVISVVELSNRNTPYSPSLPISNHPPLEMLEATALAYGELDDLAQSRLRSWLVEPAVVQLYFAK